MPRPTCVRTKVPLSTAACPVCGTAEDNVEKWVPVAVPGPRLVWCHKLCSLTVAHSITTQHTYGPRTAMIVGRSPSEPARSYRLVSHWPEPAEWVPIPDPQRNEQLDLLEVA